MFVRMESAPSREQVSRLEVRVEQFWFEHGDDRPYLVVKLYVDGTDLLAGRDDHGGVGWDPDEILIDESPLLPATFPRRVALYRCGCGEPGCGNQTPLVSENGGYVDWSDFQSYTAVFEHPLLSETVTEVNALSDRWVEDGEEFHFVNLFGEDEGEHASHKVDLPDLRFDSSQYRTEVARAVADHSWELEESESEQVVRLLRRHFAKDTSWLNGTPWTYEVVFPSWRRPDWIVIHLRIDNLNHHVLGFSPTVGTPRERAQRVIESLETKPPKEWPVLTGE